MKLSRSLLIDTLIVLAGVSGALFFSYLFLKDINATLTRLEEQPIGIITFRYNIAQRRFNDRRVWDRLRNNSPVYNGDVIRTDNLSEVTISFDHGDAISLYSNTLVQLFTDSGGSRIDFSSGELIINTPETITEQPVAENRRGLLRRRNSEGSERTGSPRTERSIVINTGDQRVRVDRGSAIRFASNDEGELELSVNEGSITLEEAPEEPANQRRRRNQENPENSILAERRNSERTGTERPRGSNRTESTDRPGSPRTGRSENTGTGERTGSARTERSIVINTGEQRIRTERGSSIRVDSQNGELAISVNEGAMVLESAVTDETLAVESGRRVRLNRRESGTTIEDIESDGVNTNSRRDRTATNREPRELLPSPRNRVPADQHTITAQMIIDSRSLTFSWDSVRDANGYILTIFRDNEGFRSTVLETPILTETTYTLENIRRYRGNLYWQVEAVRVSDDGSIAQHGQLRENKLIVDIPRRENAPGSERTGSEGTTTPERSSPRRERSQ